MNTSSLERWDDMFPYDIEEEEVDEEKEQEEQSIPVEYGIDFESGQLTGQKVYGIEALKVWIWNALVTDRYRYEHHSWNFGHELENLIGSCNDIDYIRITAKEMIEECLTVNEHIIGIEEFDADTDGESLFCYFRVVTDLGNIEGVNLNV